MDRRREPCLAELSTELRALSVLVNERHERYAERNEANREALKTALAAAEKASDKTETALKEYKISANEWRDTMKDLMARMPQREEVNAMVANLSEKIADLRESRSAGTGSAQERHLVKDETRANLAILISFVVLMFMFVKMLMGK